MTLSRKIFFIYMVIQTVGLLFPLSSFSASDNPLLLPVGEQEALMGNTGIALSGSPANALYNPAGIADIAGTRLTVTGSTYALIKAQFDASGASEDLTFTSFNAVPNMVIGAKRFNTWTVTYGIFSPSAIEISADYSTPIPQVSGNARMMLNRKSEEQYLGVGTARKTGNGWSYGASIFGHRFHEREVNSLFVTPTIPAAPTSPYLSSASKIDTEVVSLLAIIGIQKVVSDSFQWGFRLGLPNFPVFDQSSVYAEGEIYDGTNLTKTNLDEKNRGAEYSSPLDTGLGAQWRMSAKHRVATDISVQWESSYETIPGSTKGHKTKLGTTVRGSLGYQYQYSENLRLVAGANWCPSAIRSRTSNETGEQDAALNFINFTGGIYHEEKNVVTGLGGFYATSRTDRNFFGREPENTTSMKAIGMILSSSINY